MGIHQDSEASLSPSSRNGHASGGLYRRHFDPGGVQGDGPRSCGRLSVPVGIPGLYNQQREISACYEPDHRISGFNSRHSQRGALTPASQNKNNSGGVPKIVEGRSHLGSCLGTPIGENERNSVRSSPSPSVLSPPTDGTIQHVREKCTELQFMSDFANNLLRGAAELVGHSDVQMEWEINPQDRDRPDY